ncbi:MAG: response regulator [Chryseolinea sp.]
MKILVAHRQKKTVDLIKSVLSSSNPVVLHTESGLDGLLTSRIEYFDVIICSADLPVVTGFELIRSIRTNSINRQTPVIFLSDKIDEKTLYLSNVLNVNCLLPTSEIVFQLAKVVNGLMKAGEKRPWQELVPATSRAQR